MGTFLVVDDEEDLRELIAHELAHHGHQAYEAASVSAAIQLIDQHSIDVVITDLRMPKQNGLELLAYTLTLDQRPQVILMSGLSEITLEQAQTQGAMALLAKPFRLNELLSVATKALEPR